MSKRRATIAKRLAVLLDSSESGERASARLVGIEVLFAHELFRLHLDVKAHLRVEAAIEIVVTD